MKEGKTFGKGEKEVLEGKRRRILCVGKRQDKGRTVEERGGDREERGKGLRREATVRGRPAIFLQ